MRAYDINTGQQLWDYNAKNNDHESTYRANYPLQIAGIANGILHVDSFERSSSQPM